MSKIDHAFVESKDHPRACGICEYGRSYHPNTPPKKECSCHCHKCLDFTECIELAKAECIHCKPSDSTECECPCHPGHNINMSCCSCPSDKPASPDNEILQILMRYENPIPVGMDTSKGSIELDHNETVKHLKSFSKIHLSSEKQSLYDLILKGMPEKRKRTKELVKGKSDMEFVKYGYNKAISDVTKALSEIFEEGREE